MAGLGGILGNDMLQSMFVYGVAQQLLGAALGPYLNALTAQVNSATPLAPLSPADAAEAVIRNVWDHNRAAEEARKAGIDGERFGVLERLAGNAPDPTSLAVALRRRIIDPARYLEGIRQGRLRDEWAELPKALAVQEPSPVSALDAYLQGQASEGQARDLFARWGGDPEWFDLLYNTQGQAPTPTQALELANRGIIPWDGEGAGVVSFRQAFLEGPWRNKWEPSFRALGEYLPPPRTVTAMLNEGTITRARAVELLEKQGLTPDLAAAYVSSGSAQKTEKTRDLAQSTVQTLYRERLIGRPDAVAFLEALGYDPDEADLILQIVDLEVTQRFLTAAVGRLRGFYVGHKIGRPATLDALAQLGVAPDRAGELLAIWDLEAAANVKGLSAAQWAAVYKAGWVDQATATAELVAMGYPPFDAWATLALAVKVELPDRPPVDAVNPTPGP